MTDVRASSADPPVFFSDPLTLLSAFILAGSLVLFVWMQLAVPRLDRLDDPAHALDLMVSRSLDLEEALRAAPPWERTLVEFGTGDDTEALTQAIDWYEELATAAPSPETDLRLAILEAEDGRLARVQDRVIVWRGFTEPYPAYADVIERAYLPRPPTAPSPESDGSSGEPGTAPVGSSVGLPEGWFADRLGLAVAVQNGDRADERLLRARLASRGTVLLERARALAFAQGAVLLLGLLVLARVLAAARSADRDMTTVVSLAPWTGRAGAVVLLRGGAAGAVITIALLLWEADNLLLRLLAVPLTNAPLLWLAQKRLVQPSGRTFAQALGLAPVQSVWASIVAMALAVSAASLGGEWLMGQAAEAVRASSHWTEWFDPDLAWGGPALLGVSLVDYALLAPAFEEVVFRGLLFATLRRRYGFGTAAASSAAVFAALHGYGLLGFVSVWWSGILWAWAFERTGSLWPGMLAHAANNALVCVGVLALLR